MDCCIRYLYRECYSYDFFKCIYYQIMTEEQCSLLLSKLPDVAGVDESSVEFQEVVKNFYSTIEEYHSKIKIIKVGKGKNNNTL